MLKFLHREQLLRTKVFYHLFLPNEARDARITINEEKMVKQGGPKAIKTLHELSEDYRKDGWKVIELDGRSPGAVAFKDGKAIALMSVGRQYVGDKGWRNKFSLNYFRKNYYMFDDVVVRSYLYDGKYSLQLPSPSIPLKKRNNGNQGVCSA